MMGSGSYKGGSRYDNTRVVISGKMRTAEEATKKAVWVWTKNKDVMTASVEGGWTTFVFTPDTKELANQWTCVFSALPIAALKKHYPHVRSSDRKEISFMFVDLLFVHN